MLDTYSRSLIWNLDTAEHKEVAAASCGASGLDWNYFIATYIDRGLHEKLLSFDSSLLKSFTSILVMIRSGYFETAKEIIEATTFDDSLDEVKKWLVNALEEGNDIG